MHVLTYLFLLSNIAFVCGFWFPTSTTTTPTTTTNPKTTTAMRTTTPRTTISTTSTTTTNPTTTTTMRTTTPRTTITILSTTTTTPTTTTTMKTTTPRITISTTSTKTPITTISTTSTTTTTPTATTTFTRTTTPTTSTTSKRTTTPRKTMRTTTTPTMTTTTTTPIMTASTTTRTTSATPTWTTTPTTSTSWRTNTPHSDVILLHQILTQETTLRLKLEETVKHLMADFENMKKQQSAADIQIRFLIHAKENQDVVIRQLQENIALVRVKNENLTQELSNISVENENLRQELSTIKNNSFFTSEMHSSNCNLKNVTREMKDLKTDIRYMTLSLLDIQQKTDVMQDRIDDEIVNLTARFFALENQDASILSTVENLERIRPKVENFMNETHDFKKVLLRIQHEQIKMETYILSLTNNETGLSSAVENLENFRLKVEDFMTRLSSAVENLENFRLKVEDFMTHSSEKVAFTATVTQYMTSQSGHILVFPHIITNVGGGYNGQNGVFTAPWDGVYVFFCKITGRDNSSEMFFELILNGSAKTRNLVYGRNANPLRTSSNSIVLQLTHGDRVWVNMYWGGKHFSNGVGGDQTFSGYLV